MGLILGFAADGVARGGDAMVRYEWDEAKRAANLEKHGLDFAAASRIDWEAADWVRDDRYPYPEERWGVAAPLDGRLLVIVVVIRKGARRVVSMRPANRRERGKYDGRAERLRGP